MSNVSMPTNPSVGGAMVVGQPSCRAAPIDALTRMGFVCAEADHPYDAMAQLCRSSARFSAIVLSLNSLFREELPMIAVIRKRFPHLRIWLAPMDRRDASLTEAMRLGASGILPEAGILPIEATSAGQKADRPLQLAMGPLPAAIAATERGNADSRAMAPAAILPLSEGGKNHQPVGVPVANGDKSARQLLADHVPDTDADHNTSADPNQSETDESGDGAKIEQEVTKARPLAGIIDTMGAAGDPAVVASQTATSPSAMPIDMAADVSRKDDPLLTAEELHALLQEHTEFTEQEPSKYGANRL